MNPDRKCVKFGCDYAELVWLDRDESLQTNNGFLIAKVAGNYCPNCAASYGNSQMPQKKRFSLLSENDQHQLQYWADKYQCINGVFVEVGSGFGASTFLLASGSNARRPTIHCYDYFESDKLVNFQLFVSNFQHRIIVHEGDFNETMRLLPPVAFAFIDHNHTFADTKSAYQKIWPFVKLGGAMAFHDFGHPDYPGGTRFLKSLKAGQNYSGIYLIEKS